jgi:thioredoxin-like negative regulator of GroEL
MINVQENQRAAMSAGIRSIPAMLVMKDGEVLGQIGARDRESIIEEFRDFF